MITMLNMYDIMSLFVSRIVIMYDVVADINKTTNSHMIVLQYKQWFMLFYLITNIPFCIKLNILIPATRVTTGASQKCSVQDSVMDESKSSEHSSLSQTEYSISPYARLRAEHPYDKLRSEY